MRTATLADKAMQMTAADLESYMGRAALHHAWRPILASAGQHSAGFVGTAAVQ